MPLIRKNPKFKIIEYPLTQIFMVWVDWGWLGHNGWLKTEFYSGLLRVEDLKAIANNYKNLTDAALDINRYKEQNSIEGFKIHNFK